ncbi:hypothetical protein CLOM_g8576 [Closterium sp. NIES-68]|nr:hypothetical protein CLOM_g8576 [Closterium sp. NIES-68]
MLACLDCSSALSASASAATNHSLPLWYIPPSHPPPWSSQQVPGLASLTLPSGLLLLLLLPELLLLLLLL